MKTIAALAVLAGCTGDLVDPWQLDHDRIVAVRASPPRIAAETTSNIDVLVAREGAAPTTRTPDAIHIVSPPSLATALTGNTVTAPPDAALAAARLELGLPASAPVPLVLDVDADGFTATKTVWLGDTAENPPLAGLRIDDAAPGDALVIPPATDVPLELDAVAGPENVTWLTSCGTMHDFDLPRAYLRIEPDDAQTGSLVVVLRDARGGVAWRAWPVSVPSGHTSSRHAAAR